MSSLSYALASSDILAESLLLLLSVDSPLSQRWLQPNTHSHTPGSRAGSQSDPNKHLAQCTYSLYVSKHGPCHLQDYQNITWKYVHPKLNVRDKGKASKNLAKPSQTTHKWKKCITTNIISILFSCLFCLSWQQQFLWKSCTFYLSPWWPRGDSSIARQCIHNDKKLGAI